jgi:hypothetical protein
VNSVFPDAKGMSMKKGESLVGFLETRRRTLEDAFFRKQDAILIDKFHKLEKMKETKQALQKVSGISDQKVLDKLVDLNVRPETLASLAMVPLIMIAWADGSMTAEERGAVLKAAAKNGFAKGSIDYALIESWLARRPPDSMLEAWTQYIQGLCANLNKTQIAHLRDELIGHARDIAEISGGFLGLVSKISKAERSMIDRLKAAFGK